MRRLMAVLWIAAVGLGWACSSESDAEQKTLCQPGENIFCRCRGGAAGTKTCRKSGKSFEACVSLETDSCDELPDPTTTSSTTTSAEATTTTTGGSTTTGGGGDKALLSPCESADECQSGQCQMGFCTRDCASYTECIDGDIYGECIRFDVPGTGQVQWCVPYCDTQADCAQYGAPSGCGYTLALDATPFDVCADWGDGLALPPDGASCQADTDCNLGLLGKERICLFQSCESGCYVDDDCPLDTLCSADGSGNPGYCF